MNTLNKNLSFKSAVSLAAVALLCQTAAHAQTANKKIPPPIELKQAVDVKEDSAGGADEKSAAAAGPQLLNLTPASPTTFVADGDKRCPDQPYYLYSGGKPDNFALPADPAYPSPNLAAAHNNGPTVAYDVPMVDGRFKDSFNLQNTRSVCHAVIQFRTQVSNGGSQNDGLTIGHMQSPALWVLPYVAQVINPGTATHTYALNPTGLNLLSQQTGASGGKAPSDSVLDVFLQDDTKIDFFRVFVWYGPPKGRSVPVPNSAPSLN
jgi:hypothetical protein